MFEPLLFHLFFLYSSLSLIAGLVNYARCLALGKIFLVCFYLLVETVCHLYVFLQTSTSKTESSHTAPSLLPLHMMVSPGGVQPTPVQSSPGDIFCVFRSCSVPWECQAWSKWGRVWRRNVRPAVRDVSPVGCLLPTSQSNPSGSLRNLAQPPVSPSNWPRYY